MLWPSQANDLEERRYREPRGDRYALVKLCGESEQLELPGTGSRVSLAEIAGA